MSNDPSGGQPPPSQGSQMDSLKLQTTEYHPPQPMRKNFVFVDEHNRHKRLKVMRACEGCRRRKIKCDAVTTNTWPCAACVRLKLHCVRPNGLFEDPDYAPVSFQSSALPNIVPGDGQQRQHLASQPKSEPSMYLPAADFQDSSVLYQGPAQYGESTAAQHNLHYTTIPPALGAADQYSSEQNVFPTPPLQSSRADSPPDMYPRDQYGQELVNMLGSLKVNEAGTAPYLNSKLAARNVEEEPALEDVDEFKTILPPLIPGPGLKIRIPPELMPDDETVLHYFDLFFTHVHPYVPVLNKQQFYQQWHANRESISPLLLEGIFSIAGRLADDPAQGQQWLALANRHADAFMDVPRLSTLQAMLILLKAREAQPKRGYYYRSWMTVVHCVQIGKDLGLHEHYEDHKAGQQCTETPTDCRLKTRIWQVAFLCELMVGSPQGRTDLAVEVDSVDLSIAAPLPGGEEEYSTSRTFTYLTRVGALVSRMNKVYAKIKKKKDWGLDPDFVQLNPALNAWFNDLPPDLTISYPADGSPPWLPSPIVGNIHSYYYLATILLHRPQLTFLNPATSYREWKHHMMLCYSSSKLLCRLQEAIYQTWGLTGLQSMQRGISFTVYCILSCIVHHLVAITSPDPDLNSDAREYFTRHMRVLETVMSSWPMPEMQKQIDAVREAFSADVRKPFTLRPSFPYGSPATKASSASPPSLATGGGSYGSGLVRTASAEQQMAAAHNNSRVGAYGANPISPPASTGRSDVKVEISVGQPPIVVMGAANASQGPSMHIPATLSLAETQGWNPNRIFEQWNTTFGTPQTQAQSQSSAASTSQNPSLTTPTTSSPGAPEITAIQQDILAAATTTAGLQQPTSLPTPSHMSIPISTPSSVPQQVVAGGATAYPTAVQQHHVPTFVTPAMWQDSVASVYEGGLKRSWDFDNTTMATAMSGGKR